MLLHFMNEIGKKKKIGSLRGEGESEEIHAHTNRHAVAVSILDSQIGK